MNGVTITSVDTILLPTSGYPRPALFQDDHRALLYFTGRRAPGGVEERAVAVFEGCLATRFGYPNDEALVGHPLYSNGLGFYNIYEVSPSMWMEETKAQNRVAFPNFNMPDRRHFIITLHENVFECLAKTISVRPASEFPADDLVKHCAQTKSEANQSAQPTPPKGA